MKLIAIIATFVLLSGCQASSPVKDPGVSQAVRDKIALCNAGYSLSLTAKLQAGIEKNILDGVKFDTGIEGQLRGLLMNSDKVDRDNVDSMYKKYSSCLDKDV